MADDALPGALRRDEMARLIQERGFVRVAELSRIFRTSPVTVRSDLDELQALDLVRRVHGGAVPRTGAAVSEAPGAASTTASDPEAKARAAIGAVAASLVADGDTLALGGGAATRAVARALTQRTDLQEFTVITNDLHVALELQAVVPRSTVVVTGGTLRPDEPALADPLADVLLQDLTADIGIVGCAGVSRLDGVTESNLATAAMHRRLLSTSRRRVVVAPGELVGRGGVGRAWGADQVDVLVTEATADPEQLDALRDVGVDVQTVSFR